LRPNPETPKPPPTPPHHLPRRIPIERQRVDRLASLTSTEGENTLIGRVGDISAQLLRSHWVEKSKEVRDQAGNMEAQPSTYRTWFPVNTRPLAVRRHRSFVPSQAAILAPRVHYLT
jgi:hypothetical protein